MAQPIRPSGPLEPEPPKVKPVRERVEVKSEHMAVRMRGDVIQFPQADRYQIKDGDLIVKDEDDKPLALIRSSEWDAIYYPGTVRVSEAFFPKFFDADGNEMDSPDED